MTFWCTAAALAGALLGEGCHAYAADVTAISQPDRDLHRRAASGRFCRIEEESPDAPGPADVRLGDCFDVRIRGGRVAVQDEAGGRVRLTAQRLQRGVHLFELRAPDRDGYVHVAAKVWAGGMTILPPVWYNGRSVVRAGQLGVALEGVTPEADVSEPNAVRVISGEREAIIDMMRWGVGGLFTAAFHRDDVMELLLEESIFYVRVDDPAAPPDRDAIRAALAEGREGLRISTEPM